MRRTLTIGMDALPDSTRCPCLAGVLEAFQEPRLDINARKACDWGMRHHRGRDGGLRQKRVTVRASRHGESVVCPASWDF